MIELYLGGFCVRSEKSQQLTAKTMARAVIFGGLFGSIILILMLLLSAFLVLKMRTISQNVVFGASIISSCVSSFFAGFIASRILKARGMVIGALSALLLFVIILITGTIFAGDNLSLNTLMRFAAMILAGAFGGVLGVNKKKRRK